VDRAQRANYGDGQYDSEDETERLREVERIDTCNRQCQQSCNKADYSTYDEESGRKIASSTVPHVRNLDG